MYIVALALWLAFLAAAPFYTSRARHPQTKPLAAYLIFAATFTMTAFVVFAIVVAVLGALGQSQVLADPIAAAVFLLAVFVPALLIARRQLRAAPRPPERP